MKRGPKPTPTALKLVKGDAGHRGIPQNEPTPPTTMPDPPGYLPEVAAAEWRRIVPQLSALDLMSDLDIEALAAYCACCADEQEAMAKQAGKPIVYKTTNGNLMPSPFVSIIRQARADKVRYGSAFGMTPSARVGMEVTAGNVAKQSPNTTPEASAYFPR